MALQLCIYLSRALQEKLAARQGFDPKKTGEKEAHAKPVYRTLDRAFEMLDAERLEMAGMFSVNEWRLFLDVFQGCADVKKMDGLLANAIMFENKALEHGVTVKTEAHFNVEVKPLGDKLPYGRRWAILDAVERFYAVGNIEVSAEGLKKLGILCREENNV